VTSTRRCSLQRLFSRRIRREHPARHRRSFLPQFESLEQRRLLAAVTLSGGTLGITDDMGTANDDLTISYAGGTYTLIDGGGSAIDVSSIAGAMGNNTATVTFPDTGVTGIEFNTLGGDDTLTINSVQASLTGGLTVSVGDGFDTVLVAANISTGAGATSITANQIVLATGSRIASTGGSISLIADATGGTSDDSAWVAIEGAIETATGAITVTGTGGDLSGNSDGVRLFGGGTITSTGASGAGAIQINGTTGAGGGNGILITGTGTSVSTVDADIELTADTESGSAIRVLDGAVVTSSGTGPDAGNIALTGSANTYGFGLIIQDAGSVHL